MGMLLSTQKNFLDVKTFLKDNNIKKCPPTLLNVGVAYNDKMYSDCIINCHETEGDIVIYAHKLILAAKSPYFHALFSSNWKGNEVTEIDLFSKNHIYNHIFNFIYGEEIGFYNISMEQIFSILMEAKGFEIFPLEILCSISLARYLTAMNKEALLQLCNSLSLDFFQNYLEHPLVFVCTNDILKVPGVEMDIDFIKTDATLMDNSEEGFN